MSDTIRDIVHKRLANAALIAASGIAFGAACTGLAALLRLFVG